VFPKEAFTWGRAKGITYFGNTMLQRHYMKNSTPFAEEHFLLIKCPPDTLEIIGQCSRFTALPKEQGIPKISTH
jgi:hypothetical protein